MAARRTLTALLVAVAMLASASAPASARVLSAEYSGSFSYRIVDGGPYGTTVDTRGLSWVMTIYDDGHTVRKSLVAEGSASSSSTGGGLEDDCAIRERTGSVFGPLTIGLGDDARHVKVGTFVPSETRSNLRVSGGHCNGLDGTGGALFSTPERNGALGTGNPCYFFTKARQFVDPRIDNMRLDATRKIDKTQSAIRAGSDCQTNDDITATRSIHATLRVGHGGPDDRSGPTPEERQKAFARNDVLSSLRRAALPCGWAALGAGTALWSATVGGPTAPAALVPAYVLISAGTPLCLTWAKRIADDVNIFNDPPVGNVNKIAKPKPTPSSADAAAQLASCDSQPADQQAFCAELRAAAADDIAAAQKVTAIADALLATVDRETKAHKLRKRGALKRQARAGNTLVGQMQTAGLAEDEAWGKIASILSAHGLTGSFTAAQDQTAIDALLKQLKTDGIKATTVKRLAAPALVASPVDQLTW